uniref:Uncharacterized protein n=1 Tax=Anguilla anguilla TaxID=7936 RepID=A0A0E9SCU2_ANGAN
MISRGLIMGWKLPAQRPKILHWTEIAPRIPVMTNWRVVTKSIEFTTHFLMTLKGGMKYCSEALQLELLKLLTSRTLLS